MSSAAATSLSLAALIGGVGGGVAAVLLGLFGAFWCQRRRANALARELGKAGELQASATFKDALRGSFHDAFRSSLKSSFKGSFKGSLKGSFRASATSSFKSSVADAEAAVGRTGSVNSSIFKDVKDTAFTDAKQDLRMVQIIIGAANVAHPAPILLGAGAGQSPCNIVLGECNSDGAAAPMPACCCADGCPASWFRLPDVRTRLHSAFPPRVQQASNAKLHVPQSLLFTVHSSCVVPFHPSPSPACFLPAEGEPILDGASLSRAVQQAGLACYLPSYNPAEVKFESRVARGGCATVWRGLLRKDGIGSLPVAVKLLKDPLTEGQLRRFLSEAKPGLTAGGAHVCLPYGTTLRDNRPALLAPLYDFSAQVLLDSGYPKGVPLPLALEMAVKVARGALGLHQQGRPYLVSSHHCIVLA